MAVQFTTVTVPAARANLGSLVAAALGQTIQSGGAAAAAPAPRFAQLTLQGDPANGGAVYVGGAGVTATAGKGATIPAGGQFVIGDGQDTQGDMSQLFVVSATGTQQLNVVWVD